MPIQNETQRHLKLPMVAALVLAMLPISSARPQTAPAPPAAASPAPPPAPCADPEHHQFDFWVGRWDVYGPRGGLAGHSLIESVYGCGIRENWMPLNGQNGGSLSIYVPATHRWEQYWIDSSGSRVVFDGGVSGDAMVLTGTWASSPQAAAGPLIRMTYTRGADGSVRQHGDQSTDQGHSWTNAFDFTYRPSRSPPA